MEKRTTCRSPTTVAVGRHPIRLAALRSVALPRHDLAFIRRVILLWHGDEPIGICVFARPGRVALAAKKFFGLRNPRSSALRSRR